MKKRIRLTSVFLALVLLTGCTSKTGSPEPADPTVVTQTTTVTTTTTATLAETTTATKTSVTVTQTTRAQSTTQTLSSTTKPWASFPIVGPAPNPFYPRTWFAEGTAPLEKGLTFGGETYRYAYRGTSVSENELARIADFERAYAAKVDVHRISTEAYATEVAAAISAGQPYDIVRFSGQDFPTPILSNSMAPLEEYITKVDLYDEKAPEKGGFSVSALNKMHHNFHVYGVSGTFAMDPMVLFYNKTLFGEHDLQTLSCKGNEVSGDWTWERLLPILREVQRPDDGVWGLASHFWDYTPQVVSSYGTDLVRLRGINGKSLQQNLADPQVYTAFETIRDYTRNREGGCVVDPNLSVGVSGVEDFLNSGAAAAILPFSSYEELRKTFPNVGIAPLPNAFETQVVTDYLGYGAGNGATEKGILCALAFAKHEAMAAYLESEDMPPWLRRAVGRDSLQAPFEIRSSKGSLTDLTLTISRDIAKGYNVTVVLKSYEQYAQTLIDG